MEELYTGKIEYKDKSFTFVFDGNELELIPDDQNVVFSWTHEEIGKGVYTLGNPPTIEEAILTGSCNETNKKIIFIFTIGSSFRTVNNTLYIKPRAFINCRLDRNSIDRLAFTCPELDKIFPVNMGYKIALDVDAIDEGTYGVESKPFKDHTSEELSFTFQGKEITVYFSIAKFLHAGRRTPLEYVSSLYLVFDETSDYLFAYQLYLVALEFIQFLCNRKNIVFDSIELSCPDKSGRHEKYAELVVLRDVEAEDTEINKIRAIEYQHIEGHEHALLQVISDGSLYLRHLPETTRVGRTITAATFVMITAAFEWEFRKLYPDGVAKKDKVIKAEQRITELLNQLIDEKKGEEKKILKFLNKPVGGDNLSSEIIHVGKELCDVIDPFGKYLYKINGEELKYTEMGERVAQQRNNFAHGNLDKEFIGLALLDIMFLQKIVYAMQLRRVGLDDIQIRGAINTLFHMNLYFENDERVKRELKNAQAILDNNPVLAKSPGDLKEEGVSLEDYLAAFTEPEQEKYREYYEEEIYSTNSP